MGCLFYGKWKKRSKPRRSVLVSDNQIRSGMLSATASPRSVPELYKENAHKLRVFSYSELRQATGNFSKSQKVGEGGFGCVYKGTIISKRDPDPYCKVVVAIKKLKPDGFQGHKQWVSEVQFLGIVEHPNLVKLIGYSAANSEKGIQRLLVYEYMINRSLDDHLFKSAYPALCWECRLQILLGAARGLAYLHEGMEVQVIYRDFKASNVLLDETFTPKLSDFGLAREGPAPDRSHVSTAVLGTYGYAAPDYIRTGHLSSKSDVWSFGVVLYEVLTGRRSLERNRPKSEQDLVMWVKQHMNTNFEMMMDPRLENKYSISQARQIAELADSCLVYNSKERPSMSKVVDAMERIVVGNTKTESCNRFRDEGATIEKPKLETLDSAKRRLAHLTKMSEQVEGMSTRKAVILQRNKEP